MPKIKDAKLPDIRVPQKLKEETKQCADTVDEKLSEYIYRAVEERNKKVKGRG